MSKSTACIASPTRFQSAGSPALWLVLGTLLTGCASLPGDEPTAEPTRVTGDAAELYEGQPETVFATEFPVENADDARQRAAVALADRDTDLALYLLVSAIKFDPEDAASFYQIGMIHLGRGNTGLAAKAFVGTIKIDPEHAPALEELGLLYTEAKDNETAQRLLAQAIGIDDQLWRAHNALAIMADMNKDYDAAITHYSKALELRPGSGSILNNRGFSYYLAGDWAAARADFVAATTSAEGSERAWQNLGLLYARQGDYDGALRILSRVMKEHEALNDIGYIAMLRDDYQEAERLFSEAVRLSPTYYPTAQENMRELARRRAANPEQPVSNS